MQVIKRSWQFRKRKHPITFPEIVMFYGDKMGKTKLLKKKIRTDSNSYTVYEDDYEKLY